MNGMLDKYIPHIKAFFAALGAQLITAMVFAVLTTIAKDIPDWINHLSQLTAGTLVALPIYRRNV